MPRRDKVVERIIAEVRAGNVHFGGNYGEGLGIIDTQEEVGGWPDLQSAIAPEDNDNDGMPDYWEKQNGLNLTINDTALDLNRDGYTNIENYLKTIEKRWVQSE